jgi:hypothetical protein
VDDQSIWQLLDCDLLLKLDSFVTISTLVVTDCLSLHELFETVLERTLVLNFNREVVEEFDVLSNFSTVFALHQGVCLASENVLKKVLLTCGLKPIFESIKHYVQELLCILLLPHVCTLAIVRLKTEAERLRIKVLSVRKLQETKHVHQLVKDVVVELTAFMSLHAYRCFTLSPHQAVAQSGHVVELLDHRVHITHCPKVLDATEPVPTSTVLVGMKTWQLRFVHLLDLSDPVLLQDVLNKVWDSSSSAHRKQKVVSTLNAFSGMALVDLLPLERFKDHLVCDVLLNRLEVQAEKAFFKDELCQLNVLVCTHRVRSLVNQDLNDLNEAN